MRPVVTLLVLSLAAAARADDTSATIELEAVQASNRAGQVDSQFAGLKRRFAHSGFSYASYKQVGSRTGALKKGSPVELALPRNELARVTLVRAKGPSAFELHLNAPGGHDLDVTVSCGASGILELDRDATNPDSSAALLLRYRLHCPTPPSAASDGGP